MDEPMSLTVGAVARLAGVTVRTLHHYDEIGLLNAGHRSDAGYRRYSDADLDRLQRILFYRELGFSLDEIRKVMTDSDADAIGHLRRQHAMLRDRIGRLERMASAVEKAMEARTMGINLTPEERLEVFGDFDPDEHAVEVEQRWGDTDAYRQSQRRVSRYTKADWGRIKAEGQAAESEQAFALGVALNPFLEDAACEGILRVPGHPPQGGARKLAGAPLGAQPPPPPPGPRRALCEAARKMPQD